MRIAIACEGSNVSGHFGHCEGFMVYDLNDNAVSNKEFIENPGHKPGFLPVFLKDKNVNKVIAGGMGGRAQQLFEENGIEVIVGAKGSCEDNLASYMNGGLVSTKSVCSEHEHAGECGEH